MDPRGSSVPTPGQYTCIDNISQDTHVFNTLSTAELSSTPEAQQVPDSQADTHDASLPSIRHFQLNPILI